MEPAEEASEVEVDAQEQKLRRGRKSRQSDLSPIGAYNNQPKLESRLFTFEKGNLTTGQRNQENFNAETTKKQTFTHQHSLTKQHSSSGKNEIDALLFTNYSQARSERHETTEAGIDEIYYKQEDAAETLLRHPVLDTKLSKL